MASANGLGFEIDPDRRIAFRLLSRRRVFLQFGLRNVASQQMPSPDMLYITFQFKCLLYSYVLCAFWIKSFPSF